MSRESVRKHVLEKSTKGLNKEKENPREKNHNGSFSRHLKKVYPLGIRQSNSLLLVSSLSLSQTSTETSLTDFSCPLDQKILLSLESLNRVSSMSPSRESEGIESPVARFPRFQQLSSPGPYENGEVRKCHWITKASDKIYVSFHDEQWGVSVYDDNQLFELLSLCGLLMDFNWTEILKRRCQLREAFGRFDVNLVANMREEDVTDICLNKELEIAECRVRCIVENAKGILKVAKEYGSFSSYIWGYFNYRPIINKYRYPRNVPLRTPKAETISKDLVRLGFRLVGPVITQSFIQAAGMTIDHLVDCFRYSQCVSLAENPWKHI